MLKILGVVLVYMGLWFLQSVEAGGSHKNCIMPEDYVVVWPYTALIGGKEYQHYLIEVDRKGDQIWASNSDLYGRSFVRNIIMYDREAWFPYSKRKDELKQPVEKLKHEIIEQISNSKRME